MKSRRQFIKQAVGGGASLFLAPALFAAEGEDDRQDFRHRSYTQLDGFADYRYTEADIQAEIAFGRELSAKILGRYPLYRNEEMTRYLNLVGSLMAKQGGRQELVYRFAIIEAAEVNAYSAPGGYTFITTGALDLMQDEAELAAVCAHEVAHVTERHVVNELEIRSEEGFDEADTLTALLSGSSQTARVAFTAALGQAMDLLFVSGLKQQQGEYDCDRIGSQMLLAAGYDVQALHRLLERLAQQQGDKMKILHDTHPPLSDRIVRLAGFLDEEQLNELVFPPMQQRFDKIMARPSA